MTLLITGAWRESGKYTDKIKEMGYSVSFLQNEDEPLPVPYEEVWGVIGNAVFLYHNIEKFKNLSYIQLLSAGYDRVDMEYVKRHGIRIKNAGGVYALPMAEYVVSQVLRAYKDTDQFIEIKRKRDWDRITPPALLFNKHVLILGCGSVGRECARLFSAFLCRITGMDRIKRKEDKDRHRYFDEIILNDDVNDFLKKADIILSALPLNEGTQKFLDRERLSLLKESAVLINVSRGRVIEEEALIETASRIKKVILDVFSEEPLRKDSPLWDAKNIYITPHISYMGEGVDERVSKVLMRNLQDERDKKDA